MWRTIAALLIATSMLAAATSARAMGGAGGGGGGMGVNGTNFGQSTLGNDEQQTHPAKTVKHKPKKVPAQQQPQ
jgi:hypothetical protein